MTDKKLLISFPDASQSFTNGVELGRLLEKMQRGDENIDNCKFPVHLSNKEVIEFSCSVYGYIPVFGGVYFDEWIEFFGIRKQSTNN